MSRVYRIWFPVALSILSGLLVSAQVFLAHRAESGNQRCLVALRDLPRGSYLHPRDFSFTPITENAEPGILNDQAAHLVWHKRLMHDLSHGDRLRLDDVEFEPAVPTPKKNRTGRRGRANRSMEIIREEGEG